MITDDRLLVVIAGPTAVGKTSLAIALAQEFGTEIISGDSRQFYREMRIGTAVPTDKELALVPHHFIHHLSVTTPYNVSKFETDACALLDQLFISHKIVIMAGGSGLYLNAVCHGIDRLPDPDPEMRRHLKEKLVSDGIEALQEELARLDPEHFAQVDLSNPVRVMRAIEICRSTGMPLSALRTNLPVARNFRIMKFGLELPREILYQRINARVDALMQAGLYEEALALYPLRNLNALNTVGYRELFDHFEGLTTLSFAIEKIKTNSRRYAKRQMTWFKKDDEYNWVSPEDVLKIASAIRNP